MIEAAPIKQRRTPPELQDCAPFRRFTSQQARHARLDESRIDLADRIRRET
jgi:hypothetical protein